MKIGAKEGIENIFMTIVLKKNSFFFSIPLYLLNIFELYVVAHYQ
jgi:hypothetical protein